MCRNWVLWRKDMIDTVLRLGARMPPAKAPTMVSSRFYAFYDELDMGAVNSH